MIEAINLFTRAGSFKMTGINFKISAGAYGVLMGRSGLGKTTLMETICGLLPAAGGEVRIHGKNVTQLRPADREIGYVPQDTVLFDNLTVKEHLTLGLEVRSWSKNEMEKRVQEIAADLEILSLLNRKPHGLSGGEKQRVALGRALSFNPSVLCLDEPLGDLDGVSWDKMCALLKTVQKKAGVTVLHITHRKEEADRLADEIISLPEEIIEEKTRILSKEKRIR